MVKFLGGFASATVLWGVAAAYLMLAQGWGPPVVEVDEAPADVAVDEPTAAEPSRARRRTRRERGAVGASTRGNLTGNATSGDDLSAGMRVVDGEGSGGEAQLSSEQIEAGMDQAMPRIRRCLILAASDEPVRGTVRVGLRVAGSGRVTGVNLSGPAAVTSGECGGCIRDAVRSVSFPRFDGSETVATYPITLE